MKKIALSLIILVLLAGCSSGGTETVSSQTPESPSQAEQSPTDVEVESSASVAEEANEIAPEPAASVEHIAPAEMIEHPAGMYKVGTDLPASTYFLFADQDAVLSSVTVKDGSGSDAKPLAVDPFTTHTIMEVKEGEYLDVKGAVFLDIAFTKDIAQQIEGEYLPEGMYQAGYHIPAGEYKVLAAEGAALSSVTIHGDATQTNPLDVQIIDGSGYVTVKDGEFIRLNGVILQR